MILHGINAQNFMSLRNCTVDELDSHVNFLVGPNGSGKTTLFRTLKAICDAFSFEKRVPFNQLCTRGVNPQEIDLTLDVEFNTSWEQELITSFLCASLSRPYEFPGVLSQRLPQAMPSVTTEGYEAFSNWLLHVFHSGALHFLFRGKLHLSYRSQNYENLRINYTFDHEGLPITITIRPADSVLVRGSISESISGGYSLINGLVDFFQSTTGLQDVVNLLTRQGFPSANSFDPVACLLYLGEKKVTLGFDNVNVLQSFLPAQRRFAELSGNLNIVSVSNRSFTFGYVLQNLLKHAFVFTNNLRVPVTDIATYSKEEVAKPEIALDNEREIPLLLYRLKNGNFSERTRFQRIQKSFTDLVGGDLGFDICARFENAQQSELSVEIQVTDPDGEIPLAYHGAGIWEALMLSTILDESEGRVIMLDEPASNLHPGMQHKLVKALHDVPGQMIVVTHSAHMLPTTIEDFCKVRRMQKDNTGTKVMGIGRSTKLKLEKVEKELNKSSDVAGLLFASGVILVEGETETGALEEWFPKSAADRGKTLADLNLIPYWVGGKTGFPFYLRFLTELGVPWVIICDGDALPPDRDRNGMLWNTLKELGLIQNIPQASSSFECLKTLAESARVYTANTAPSQKFEDIPEVKNYKHSHEVHGDGKVQQGRYIARHIPCPQSIEDILQSALKQLA